MLVKKTFKQILKWSFKRKVAKADILFFTLSKNRKLIDGKNRNIFSFVLEEYFENKLLLLERDTGAGYKDNIDSTNICFIEWSYFLLFFRARIKNLLSSKDLKDIQSQEIKRYYTKLINKTGAKLVLMVCSYDRVHIELTKVCKEMGVASAEMQHGVLNSYGYSRAVGATNYPEYFLSFGSYFSNHIESLEIYNSPKIYTVGFPYIEQTIEKASLKKYQYLKEKTGILITTRLPSKAVFITFLKEVITKLPSQFHLIIKLHPDEQLEKEDYAVALNSDFCTIFADPTVNTLELMSVSKIHCTINSTTFMESLAFGLPNILINDNEFVNEMTPHIDNEVVFKVNDSKEFIDICEAIESDLDTMNNMAKEKAKMFYSDHSTKKQIETIKLILSEQRI